MYFNLPCVNFLRCPRAFRRMLTSADRHFATPSLVSPRNDCKNSTLVTYQIPDLGSASDWSYREVNMFQPIRDTTQIWIVTRHQYGISALPPKTSFRVGGGGGGAVLRSPNVGFCSQATLNPALQFSFAFLRI